MIWSFTLIRRVAYSLGRKEAALPGKKYASIKKPAMYEDLKQKGFSKTSAAKISNAAARKATTHKKKKRRPQAKKRKSY